MTHRFMTPSQIMTIDGSGYCMMDIYLIYDLHSIRFESFRNSMSYTQVTL